MKLALLYANREKHTHPYASGPPGNNATPFRESTLLRPCRDQRIINHSLTTSPWVSSRSSQGDQARCAGKLILYSETMCYLLATLKMIVGEREYAKKAGLMRSKLWTTNKMRLNEGVDAGMWVVGWWCEVGLNSDYSCFRLSSSTRSFVRADQSGSRINRRQFRPDRHCRRRCGFRESGES